MQKIFQIHVELVSTNMICTVYTNRVFFIPVFIPANNAVTLCHYYVRNRAHHSPLLKPKLSQLHLI
jgi:hypothetical protein